VFAGGYPSSEKPRILIIEDEPAIRSALRRFFGRRGWECYEAGDGAVGGELLLACAPGREYAVVISDLRMPGYSGIQLHDGSGEHRINKNAVCCSSMRNETETPAANADTPEVALAVASGASSRGTHEKIPAFVNPKSDSAEQIRDALSDSRTFEVQPPDDRDLGIALREAVERGATRLLVAGGDGTVRSAAEVVAGTTVELAIIPGGTLNHFAKFHEIPEDAKEAATIAANGEAKPADAAYVNHSLFLNTSSVGAYVKFVRFRERLEKLHIPYAIASLVATLRTLVWLRTFRITLSVDGVRREIDTPLVFIAVGEREVQFPTLGDQKEGGDRGMHVVLVEGKGRARVMLMSAAMVARGADGSSPPPTSGLQSFMTESLRIDTRRPRVGVALDGEIKEIEGPLEYRFARDTLRVVTPASSHPAPG